MIRDGTLRYSESVIFSVVIFSKHEWQKRRKQTANLL